MRLTLRTLLAWLDDTLEPSQVKDIGKQVAESPFALELSDRIHRVTRQRRLSVPSQSGPEATDPNIVAGYLDNDLDPESVAEFEKKCLTSDVNLAEVASVHQILSLLGQKVQVPPEARNRMYQLVKGRETVATKPPATRRAPAPEPVTKPIQPWVAPEPPKRPWIERFGPALACIALIAVCIATAWRSLSAPPTTQVVNPPVLAANAGPVAPPGAEKPDEPTGETAKNSPDVAGETTGPPPDRAAEAGGTVKTSPTAETETAKVAAASTEDRSKDTAVPSIPSGSSALAEKTGAILLRYNAENREWDRLTSATPLNRNDRVLCLTPFRAAITMAKVRIILVAETEVRILSASSDPVPSLELVQGRLIIRQPASSTLKVVFSNRTVTLGMTPESTVALERIEPRTYGQPILRTQPLAICCIQGGVSLTIDGKQEELKESNLAIIDSGQVRIATPDRFPPWSTQPEPTPYEQEVGDRFLKLFHPGRPILAELVAAIEDEHKEIKDLAVRAMKARGDLSLLMPMLSREGDPIARRLTIDAIRSYMSLGPDAANRVRAQLDEEFGENVGAIAQHMLVGYSPDEIAKGDIYPRIVGLLSPDQPSVGIRELALDTLRRLTGRDDLGYDPDHPQGKGLDAWNDLLRRNELRPLRPQRRSKAGSDPHPSRAAGAFPAVRLNVSHAPAELRAGRSARLDRMRTGTQRVAWRIDIS